MIKSITRTVQVKTRRSYEMQRFLKSFPIIFFSQELAFPRHQLTFGNTSNQKVADGTWLNLLHWDISRAGLECFMKRYSQQQAELQLRGESKART